MSFNYNYTATTGNVKVQNVVFGFDKFKGLLTCQFDMKAFDPAGGDNIDITLVVQGKTANLGITEPDIMWKRYIITLDVGLKLDLKDWGAQSPILTVYDENNTLCYTETGSIKIDLDPIEFECSVTSHPFGDDNTPDVTFELDDLQGEQTLIPIITVGVSNSSGCYIYLDDGDGTTTSVNQSSNRFGCLNGVLFSESSMLFSDASPQDATYFKRIDSYKITAPTMASGQNTYTINLQANAV